MQIFDVQEILRRKLSGASRQAIVRELRVPQSTKKLYLNRVKQASFS